MPTMTTDGKRPQLKPLESPGDALNSSSSAIEPGSQKKKPRTQSVAVQEPPNTILNSVGRVIRTLFQAGWLTSPSEICALERTCRAAKDSWFRDEGVWKMLAFNIWPQLIDLTPLTISGRQIHSYRSLFCDPILWIQASAERVKALPNWKKIFHGTAVECGKCGCNCNNSMGVCPGIPIEGKFRWRAKVQKEWPDDRMGVPNGEGYFESGGEMIALNFFCEPCFRRLVELKIINQDEYVKEPGVTLFTYVTRLASSAKPRFAASADLAWHRLHDVEADDVAVVVANALIQVGCKTRHLGLDGIRCNDRGFSPVGYKALAFALGINKTVGRIDFYPSWMDEDEEFFGPLNSFSYAEDKSNGLFLKAFQHNKGSTLKKLRLCPRAFGPHTTESWTQAKPDLECGPELESDMYHDWENYIHFDAGDESGDY